MADAATPSARQTWAALRVAKLIEVAPRHAPAAALVKLLQAQLGKKRWALVYSAAGPVKQPDTALAAILGCSVPIARKRVLSALADVAEFFDTQPGAHGVLAETETLLKTSKAEVHLPGYLAGAAKQGARYVTEIERQALRATDFVYVMQAENGLVKVGMSQDPAKRQKTLEGRLGWRIDLVETFPVQDPRLVEKLAHFELGAYWVEGEWFGAPVEVAVEAVKLARRKAFARKAEGQDYSFLLAA